MGIEAAIHERWTLHRQLCNLLPASKLWTGEVPLEDTNGVAITAPYAAIDASDKIRVTRTSSQRITSGTLTLKVWAATLTEVQAVIDEAVARFDRSDFPFSNGRVLDMRPGTASYGEEADNDDSPIWSGTIPFEYRLLEVR